MSGMKHVGRLAKRYEKRYGSLMTDLRNSPLAKVRPITEWDIVALGRQLEAFELEKEVHEADGNVSQLGPLPKIALDVITAAFGVSPLAVVAGIQPIDEVKGLVWFKDYVAQSTRGNVTPGQDFWSPDAAPGVYPIDYADNSAVNTTVYSASNGAQSVSNQDLTGGQDFYKPLNPQTATITASAIFNAGADTANFGTMTVDPVSGEFGGSRKVNGTLYSMHGTVDFTNATASFEFSADPSGQTTVTANFEVLAENATDIAKAILKMRAKEVTARFFALKQTFGFAEKYMMNKRWGIDAEADMAKDLTSALNNEVFNIVLAKILANVPSGNNVTWQQQAPSGTSFFEHQLTLKNAMTMSAAKITKSAGRGTATAWIAGLDACAILENLPGFNKLFDDMTLGAHVYGTFNGATVVRVPGSSQLDGNTIIGIYKGDNPFEATATYAPYMPLTLTPVQGTGTNPLLQQQAAACWGAVESMIPNFSTKVTIDPAGFAFGG